MLQDDVAQAARICARTHGPRLRPAADRAMTKAGGDATFSQLATEIVTSKQFRYRREREDSPPHRRNRPQQTRQRCQKNPDQKKVDYEDH